MPGIRDLEQGIKAIQAGNHKEGARFLRIAMRDPSLTNSLRATAYIWLAETNAEREFKIKCYNDALTVDPNNEQARQRLDILLAQGLPPLREEPPAAPPSPPNIGLPPMKEGLPMAQPVQPLPPAQPPPYQPPQPTQATMPPSGGTPAQMGTRPFYRTVTIIDGPNGMAAAFFVTTDGLLATTRLAVSGMENVTVELKPEQLVLGQLVRSFPEMDLALIQTEIQVSHTIPFSRDQRVQDNEQLTAVYYGGQEVHGRCRATKRALKPHWIPTTFRDVPGAGGSPILDDRRTVVGMLTTNASRSSEDVFGLHIATIASEVQQYLRDRQAMPNATYCLNCGSMSRAANQGAFYCETCGSTLSYARSMLRVPVPHTEALYGENLHRPCPHCQSRVGYYDGRCLRCGRDIA